MQQLAMAQDSIEDPRLTAVGLLIEAATSLLAELQAVHSAHGLAGSDFDTLLRLARSPGRRLRLFDLAAQVGRSTSGITRIVDRLDGRGLLRREPADDRRGWWAVITDAGCMALSRELPELLEVVQRSYIDPLSQVQLDALDDALRTVRDALRPKATAGSTTTGRPRPRDSDRQRA